MDDDYVYLLERFMTEEEDIPETSNYRQQVQMAIEESISMSNQNNQSYNIPKSKVEVIIK